MEDSIIDFGKIKVPTSWDEISLKKFKQLENIYSKNNDEINIIDIVSVMIDKDRDFVMTLPTEFLETILEKLQFLNEQPNTAEPTNKIELDGVVYQVNVMNKLKMGEYTAVDNVVKHDAANYAAILGILCRKDGEIFDSKFENEILEDRIKMFENAPITKILPCISFFLNCYILSETPSLLFSQVEEELNLIASDIENSAKIGVCKKYYLSWRLKRLQKSLRSIKNI